MGPETRRLLASIKFSAEEKLYVKLVEKSGSHFVHPPNVLYDSAKFHKRVQHADECVDKFYAELQRLVGCCGFSPPVEERLVRDRFLIGRADRQL